MSRGKVCLILVCAAYACARLLWPFQCLLFPFIVCLFAFFVFCRWLSHFYFFIRSPPAQHPSLHMASIALLDQMEAFFPVPAEDRSPWSLFQETLSATGTGLFSTSQSVNHSFSPAPPLYLLSLSLSLSLLFFPFPCCSSPAVYLSVVLPLCLHVLLSQCPNLFLSFPAAAYTAPSTPPATQRILSRP